MLISSTPLKINGQLIPVKIYSERRVNARAALGRTHFILRLPQGLAKQELNNHLSWFEKWVTDVLAANPKIKEQFDLKAYKTADTFKVGDRTYGLEVSYEDRKTHTAQLKHGTIHLKLCKEVNPLDVDKATKQLLSAIVAQDFQTEIEQRVQVLNALHFNQPIKKVVLRYNHSKWGSCSSSGVITLSTRLLFAPKAVIDYVIIHELAHLLEMNHSDRFWNIVEERMPNYRQHEQWLKINGHLCSF